MPSTLNASRSSHSDPPAADLPTRDRILRSARQLFYVQGYEATSLKQVCAEARVNPGSLYYFFPSKADLLEAVLSEYLDLLDPVVMAPAREAAADPFGKVLAVLDGYRRHLIDSDFRLGCPIGNLALEVSDTHPAARRLISRNFSAWRVAVADILADVEFPSTVDPVDVATLVLSVMEGGVMQSRNDRSIDHFDASVRSLRMLFQALHSTEVTG